MMNRLTAQDLIDSYCDDEPLEGAVGRLMNSTLTEADLCIFGNGTNDQVRELQDRIDEILYGPPGSQQELLGRQITTLKQTLLAVDAQLDVAKAAVEKMSQSLLAWRNLNDSREQERSSRCLMKNQYS